MPDEEKLPLFSATTPSFFKARFKAYRPSPLDLCAFSNIQPTPVQSSQSHTQSSLEILNFSPIPPPSPISSTSPTPLSPSTPKESKVADDSTPLSYSDDDEPKLSPANTPPKNTP